jgi:hypothetical protein
MAKVWFYFVNWIKKKYFVLIGIEPSGNQVGAPAKFHVETFAAGQGNVEPIVINPKGQREKVRRIYIDIFKINISFLFI